jgi:glyoxylase-like metal-dependent hydrolase (beta-lactamase superfamily II)
MDQTSDIFVSSVDGNGQWLDGGSMFGNVPKALWERWVKADGAGRIKLACRAMLVEFDGLKILCETGIGSYMEPELAKRFGVDGPENALLLSLEALGVMPEHVDFVILSHLHFDHAGGLLSSYREQQEGKMQLHFPRAKYVVGKEAWARAVQPHARDKASFIPSLQDLLLQSGRLIVIDGHEIPGLDSLHIQVRYSSGHTPGHLHTLVRGERETFFFAGDLVPGRPWIHLPVTMGYDRFAEMVIDEKSQLYQEALSEGWNLFFTHDVDVASAKLAKDDKARYSPVKEHTVLTRYAV